MTDLKEAREWRDELRTSLDTLRRLNIPSGLPYTSKTVLVLTSLIDRVDRMDRALTPSAETKAAFLGEFQFSVAELCDDGHEVVVTHTVPWTTIKEIMAAIRARQALQ